MMKLMNGKLVVDLVAFSNMGNIEFNNQFETFVDASLKLVMPDGSEREYTIAEIISADVEGYDQEGIKIVEADLIL